MFIICILNAKCTVTHSENVLTMYLKHQKNSCKERHKNLYLTSSFVSIYFFTLYAYSAFHQIVTL